MTTFNHALVNNMTVEEKLHYGLPVTFSDIPDFFAMQAAHEVIEECLIYAEDAPTVEKELEEYVDKEKEKAREDWVAELEGVLDRLPSDTSLEDVLAILRKERIL